MLRKGSKVTVESADHHGTRFTVSRRLVGRTGTVVGHDETTGMNEVAGLTVGDRRTGYRRFSDADLAATGETVDPATLPTSYRVRSHWTTDEEGTAR